MGGPNVANRTATLYIHYKKADGKWAYSITPFL
jgi:hypothetical protein